MRKHAVLFTLTVLEMVGLALSAFFWFVMRADLTATYRGAAMPVATSVALSTWFVPVAAVAGGLLVLGSWAPRLRTRTRTFVAATGLVCTVFALAFAIWASYAPAFEQLGPSGDTNVRFRRASHPRPQSKLSMLTIVVRPDLIADSNR